MNQYFSADYILPVAGEPIVNGVVEVDDQGIIQGVWRDTAAISTLSNRQIKRYKGIIVPGFINAHCHLELSHLHKKVDPKTGLVRFLKNVIDTRQADEKTMLDAMQQADRQMADNGIVAVGDHANTTISAGIKRKSNLYYHTFLELLGNEPERADEVWQYAADTKVSFGDLPASITPHAPYSVSKELLRLVRIRFDEMTNLISMHNQESEAENDYYRFKSGDFVDFYKWLQKDASHFKPRGVSSLRSIASFLPRNQRIQLVHNTFTGRKDAHMISRLGRDVYWCLCPNANLYIENTLPRIEELREGSDFPITLGTDSLASNDKLCVLAELKTLHQHFPNLELKNTIHWATRNGAEFLGITDRFGTIERGKSPGLNLLSHTEGLSLTDLTTVEKLV